MAIAEITNIRGGRKKVKFNKVEIYTFLNEVLGFRYAVLNKEGYYLKNNNGIYECIIFDEIKYTFRNYIENNFDSFEFSNQIKFKDFINEFFAKRPIQDSNLLKSYLKKNLELSEENKQLLINYDA